MAIILLLSLAVAPGIAIAMYVYFKDVFEKEPLGLLVKCFFLGTAAVLPALLLEVAATGIGLGKASDAVSVWVKAFVVAGMIEEGAKFTVLRWYAYPKKDFNEPFDGITYAVMISMGFATLENIAYVLEGGWQVGVLRMFLSVPGHATFAVLMGYFVGLSKFRKNNKVLELVGLGSAAALHGAFDFFLMMQNYPFLALGAIASLALGIQLSMKAMRSSEKISPFRRES